MDSNLSFNEARALLAWQIEMGADEAIGAAPVDRFAVEPPEPALAESRSQVQKAVLVDPAEPAANDAAEVARAAAVAAGDLESLAGAIAAFDRCELKRGARTTVFSDGLPGAHVMIIGEAPGRDEDLQGKPFVGRAGQLLDRMLAAIGLDRGAQDPAVAAYITNILPWRPPQNREPTPEEIGMMLPFVERHVALAGPRVLVLMGNISCQALLGRRGITRLRGQWTQVLDRPALPMFHPAYLLRNPHAKREAWADLLALKARLSAEGG